jgi:hypothetical protein
VIRWRGRFQSQNSLIGEGKEVNLVGEEVLVAEEVDVLVQNLKEKLRVGGKQSQVKNSNQRVKDLLKAGEAVKVVDLAEEHPVLRK